MITPCADNSCNNIDEEVKSEEWRQEMLENVISESDIKKLEEFINKIYDM